MHFSERVLIVVIVDDGKQEKQSAVRCLLMKQFASADGKQAIKRVLAGKTFSSVKATAVANSFVNSMRVIRQTTESVALRKPRLLMKAHGT